MTNTKPEWEAEFDSLFNWADQVKESETERWRLMYGLTPEQLKSFLKETVEKAERRVLAEAKEAVRKCPSPNIPQTQNIAENIRIARSIDRGDALDALDALEAAKNV